MYIVQYWNAKPIPAYIMPLVSVIDWPNAFVLAPRSTLILDERLSPARVGGMVLILTGAVRASSEQGRGLIAWLLSLGIGTLQKMGVKTLNLGGGVRAGDGLYQFKEKFGGTLSPLKAVQQIYDEDRYNDLCRAADITEPVEWFPAYRANPASTRATQQQQL